MRSVVLSAAVAALVVAVPAAQSPDARVRALLDGAKFKQAIVFIQSDQDRFVRELIALTEIPAPPFKEQARGKAYMAMLRQVGLSDVETDPEGNVMGIRRGSGPAGGPVVLVNAHLDTVFPEGTDVTVKRQGTRLTAPGVGDDTRGLALLLALVRTLDAAKFTTPGDILFAGNVGEEGEGDLRGIKFLLKTGKYKDRIKQVVAIDGNESNGITRGGLGSRRYRVTFKGPGGHSYGAFGLVNPAFAMGGAIAKFARLEVPTKPRTTFNVGVVRGGTSINSIPAEVSMDVDMRSEACSELNRLDQEFLAVVGQAVDEENRTRSTKEGRVEADPKVIGERPCGETPSDAPIVLAAAAAIKAFGLSPVFSISSTDANIPMSLGIPAVTIGHGGPGARSHAPDEWVDVDPAANVTNVQVALATLLAVAGGG
jgi:tripeptide aminopeptidase